VPVYRIPREHLFPHPSLAEPDGLLGVGGDVHPDRMLFAYANGIFPWYSQGQPILWFSPDPRFVLEPSGLVIQRSLKKRVRRGDYRITMDTAFRMVVNGCKATPRPRQPGTWITRELEASYHLLHERGFAHSVEAWLGEELVGGLFGVSVGRFYSGESMFAREPDASKVGFVWLARQLRAWDFGLIDCQVYTEHLERFGALPIPRSEYLPRVAELTQAPERPGPWRFDPGFDPLA
jgi:leucyl/phenylalanyl-tRNA---protein transferase